MRILSFSIAALIACTAVGDTAPKNMTFSTTLKSVAVFRDGFGFYVREGQVKLENGWATTDLVPAAIRGTIRFYTLDKKDHIDQVVIGKENKLEFASPAEIKARLANKVGLKLAIVTHGGQKFEGELSKILDDMILLKVGDAFTGIPYSSIQTILLAGFPVRIKVTSTDPGKTVGIGVAYLQEGIRWEPSYILDFHGAKGSLSLRATMQNTTEALKSSEVFFVVGSPFVANRGIADILTPNAAPAPSDAGAEAKQDVRIRAEAFEEAKKGSVDSATVARDEAGELYYYKKSDLSLAPSDVAMVSVFDVDVPVASHYEWNADGEEVTYLLDVLNKSTQPLTTGPVFVLEDGKAIGQEQVRYTAAGGDAEIRLSRGIGLKVEKAEAESHRGAPAHIGKTDYIPVFLRGTLTITNYRTVASTVKVTKTLRGKVDALGDKGTIKQTQILSGEPNPINDVEWKIVIPAGTTKTIQYSFETYMSAERAGSPPVPAGNGDKD